MSGDSHDFAGLIKFIRQKEADELKSYTARLQEADSWRNSTDEEEEAGCRLAEKSTGRKYPRHTFAERQKLADMQSRIAVKIDRDAKRFKEIAEILECLNNQTPATSATA